MARLNKKQLRRRGEQEAFIALSTFIHAAMGVFRLYLFIRSLAQCPRPDSAQNPDFYQSQLNAVNRLVNGNEVECHEQLRVNRRTFFRLCCLVRSVGLGDSRFVCLEERVAIFLWILAHHTKQRRTKHQFYRSTETISRHFNAVLQAVLRLHRMLLVIPDPVPADYHDDRWSWFQNCLGALDGTYVPVNPPTVDRPRYRSRKGELATNVLGVCTRDLQFVFVLSGWEGSATDSRILRDTIARPNGLKVPRGHYYLVDAGYTNGEGFLAPYRGQRYHLNIWRQGHMPASKEEYEKAHPQKAKEIYGKRFPYYDDWTIVFGKDRATGAGAEDPTQMEQQIPPTPLEEEIGGVEDLTGEGFGGDFYQPLFEDDQFLNSPYASMASTPTGSTPRVPTPFTDTPTGSTPRTSTPLGTTPTPPVPARRMAIPTATTPPANAGAKKGKKRTRMGEDEETRDSMNTFCRESLIHMDKIANSLGYDKELTACRSTIPAELEKLNLTLTQEFRVAAIIGEKDERVYQFLDTRDEKKQAWVEAVLNGEVYGPV